MGVREIRQMVQIGAGKPAIAHAILLHQRGNRFFHDCQQTREQGEY